MLVHMGLDGLCGTVMAVQDEEVRGEEPVSPSRPVVPKPESRSAPVAAWTDTDLSDWPPGLLAEAMDDWPGEVGSSGAVPQCLEAATLLTSRLRSGSRS